MASKFHLGIDLNGQRAQNAGAPSTSTDLTTKAYVDSAVQGLGDLKDPVRVATTGPITLTGAQTIDGIAVVAGDRVLVKNQGTATDNGIYVAAAGAWVRATDADESSEITSGFATTVLTGTNKGTSSAQSNPVTYILTTTGAVVIGTTALSFSPIGAATALKTAGAGLIEDGTSYSVGSGTGITVAADSISVDTAIVVRKAAANNVNATSSDITHNFGHSDITWSCRLISTGAYEYPDVSRVDDNTTRFTFATAPAAGTYRLVVHG